MTATKDSSGDAALLQRLRAGEADAFEQLVKTHHGAMLRIAKAIIGPAQAEEAVQDAWLAAIRNLATFAGRSSLKTWLVSIVRNEAISRLRKQKFEVSLGPDDGGQPFGEGRFDHTGHWSPPPTAWHDDSPEALLSHEDFRRCLEKTLAKLPDQQRSVLILRDQEEMPLEEICNLLSITASNVRVLIHRARVRLYKMIEHFEETGKC